MARRYKLDHFTKGTGANVVPAEDEASGGGDGGDGRPNTVLLPAEPRGTRRRGERRSTALPAGHVRKKATGELGRVESIDPKSGTATVYWLRQGRASVVPLTTVARR